MQWNKKKAGQWGKERPDKGQQYYSKGDGQRRLSEIVISCWKLKGWETAEPCENLGGVYEARGWRETFQVDEIVDGKALKQGPAWRILRRKSKYIWKQRCGRHFKAQ